jgi:tRNA dimethylallyltransferase
MTMLDDCGAPLDSAPGREPAGVRVGFLVGPTGAGKSALAIEVAEQLGAEIVNADSRQFYLGLDIGTAKPTVGERRRVPHHLIDVRTPDRPLDVAEFGALARSAIADIAARGRRPLVVGGSGLYLRVLRGGIFPGAPASPQTRARLAAIAAARGVPYLHSRLAEVDPEAARRIGHNDLYRIVRALEVYEATGEPISRHQRRHAFAGVGYATLVAGIAPERKRLYEAIDRRFDAMIAAGFVDEVRGLLARGCLPDTAPLKTIGYKQIAAFVRGEVALDDAIALAKRDSRRLAKRQMTWFRRDPEIRWLDPSRAAQQALDLFRQFFGCSADS